MKKCCKKASEESSYEMWERCGKPMLCFRCGKLITFWNMLFRNNYDHCIIGDSHKVCKGEK